MGLRRIAAFMSGGSPCEVTFFPYQVTCNLNSWCNESIDGIKYARVVKERHDGAGHCEIDVATATRLPCSVEV